MDVNRIKDMLALPGVQVEVCEATPSTNDVCRSLLSAGARECIVLAETQTGGRGRRGRRFFSPPGGLYMSVGFPAAPDALRLTCRAAVVTAETIEALTGRVCGIKWVNDLLYCGKKVCGILAETAGESVIVGVGVNLMPVPLPPELAGTVGFLDCGDVRERLAAKIACGLLLRDTEDLSFMEEYRCRSVVLGREITCSIGQRVFSAKALEIDDNGALIVAGPDGREVLQWGEVSIHV